MQVFNDAADTDAAAVTDGHTHDVTVTDGRWNAGVKAGGREALLSKAQGGLVSFTRDGHEMLSRKPSLLTFRPLTDNDAAMLRLRPCTMVRCRPLRQDGRYRNRP